MSRIYSDETPGVVRAASELVDDKDELKTYQSVRVSPVYVETYLLSLMNAEVRRSTRLANKPSPRYKETEDRKRKHDGKELERSIAASGEKEQGDKREDHSPGESLIISTPRRLPSQETGSRLLDVSSNLGIAFPECIRGRYEDDPFFQPIIKNPIEFTNFKLENVLIYFVSGGVEAVAMPNVKVEDTGIRELLIRQGHSILAHLSAEKTATYLREQIWWKTMVKDISEFCRTCHTCATSKPQSGKPHGKLKTMPVPSHPWQYIGIDFVGPLPESVNRTGGYDMICVAWIT